MRRLLVFILLVLSNFACRENRKLERLSVDSLLTTWNQSTLKSLAEQVDTVKDTSAIELYKNRLEVFEVKLYNKNFSEKNRSTIRYKFLDQLKTEKMLNGNSLILEADKSGERLELRNFLVHSISKGKIEIIPFEFKSGVWSKKMIILDTLYEDINNSKQLRVKFGSGFNEDDIIITQIKDGEIIGTEYYIFSTLSSAASFKKYVKSQ